MLRNARRWAALLGRVLLLIAFALLAAASLFDWLQMQSPGSHHYFYASRWLGTGLTLGLLACAGFWLSPKYDAVAGDESQGYPALSTWLVLAFYGASWAVRKHDDRLLSELAAMLSFTGFAGMLALAFTKLRSAWRRG